MRSNNISDGVLVFDRYYSAKPRFITAVLKKILLSGCITVFCMLYIMTEYDLPAGTFFAAGVSLVSVALFSVLFAFVRKRFAIPAVILLGGVAVWLMRGGRDGLWEKLSYFADAAMLTVEGRFLFPRGYLFHSASLLTESNPLYVEGVKLGFAILCIIFALVTAAAVSGRVHALPPALLFVALCVPPLIGERLEVNIWLIPALAFLFGAAAISFGYSQGMVIGSGSARTYRRIVLRENKKFEQGAKEAPYLKRIKMRENCYSKYFSSAMYCAAVFSVVGMIAYSLLGNGNGIDYTSFYEFITGIGDASGITASPFESGPVSEYFTSPESERHETENGLSIISPGSGEQNIIRVTYTGEQPLYLRGDIGIDFTGTSWTSPVNEEPVQWSASRLKADYRPIEQRVVRSVLEALGAKSDYYIELSDVAIDYLCESSVVFLPSYTADYTYYGSEIFDVYGDVVVRVNKAYGNVNRVQCTALVPSYTDTDSASDNGAADVKAICDVLSRGGITVNSIYPSVIGELADTNGLIKDYGDYVNAMYMSVPEDYREPLKLFLEESGLAAELDELEREYYGGSSEYIYSSAKIIADYLRSNYTYSLRTDNGSAAPVLSFLNETHSGHCALYASAMTLLLRESGIPARYCTGFAVDPSRGDGVQTMRAKNLHAWVEVYLGELGWATFDPTSSSVYPSGGTRPAESERTDSTETPEPSSEQTQSAAESTASSEEIESSDTTDTSEPSVTSDDDTRTDESSGNAVNILPFILIAAAVLIVAAAAWYSVYRYRALARSAEKAVADMLSGKIPSARIYEKLLSAAAMFGVTPKSGELPVDFYRRADSVFGTQLGQTANVLESVAFGKGDSDRVTLAEQFDKMYRNACASSGIMRKIKLRRLICQK